MLEARLAQAALFKKLLESIKELVTDANFECNEEGINLQAMDNSHVALVAVKLGGAGFTKYRCDRPMPLGVNLASLSKVLKCAKDDDQVTLKAGDNNDVLNLLYESPATDRIAEYEMKLMDIDADQLGIPDTDYDANVIMSSSEFARIVRDLSNLGESVRVEVTKEGLRFTSEGDAANGSVLLKHSDDAARLLKKFDKEKANGEGSSVKQEKKANGTKVKKEKGSDDEEEEDEEMAAPEEEDEDEVEEVTPKKEKKKKGKSTEQEEEEEEEANAGEKEHEEEEEEESEEEETSSKKRKKSSSSKEKSSKRPKKEKKEKEEEEVLTGVIIRMTQPVNLNFSLKYLINFTKSTALAKNVHLSMSNDVPLLVSYDFGPGSISYFLAPKIGDE